MKNMNHSDLFSDEEQCSRTVLLKFRGWRPLATQYAKVTTSSFFRRSPRLSSLKVEINSSSMLSQDAISKYFYMSITLATKEFHIGLTFLKNRYRDLGITRWPHRKLIKKLKNVIKVLKKEKKMEEILDMELEEQTRRLRQACFKAIIIRGEG
ncbi:hypothetical protein R3W88_014539 [Solanum pinnatisectum]|uniref:RWP-RK domain-containing protein n=1 Tax=Solanum pinnatisectum TaxID=50273 RepID=A0AAV9KRZ5_9SOLN|nr:hypothetical protein R3W88_014539 [Solanum pinnatisectum]